MSLLSLLFALAIERSMPSKVWQFSFYFREYLRLAKQSKLIKTPLDNIGSSVIFILLPVLITFLAVMFVDGSIFQLALSCVVLLVCIGCHFTRNIYKAYLQAAFRGEMTTCDLHYQQLIQDKNLPDIGLGQALIWLNFRYYIVLMITFVCFGLPAVVFYRVLLAVVNYQAAAEEEIDHEVQNKMAKLLFWLEWPIVRIVSFCYMLVGNFSKALPTWLESCFDFTEQPYHVLSSVAQQSEDFQLDDEDCTAEPCLLVRLAKRALLLLLAIIAVLTITGIIN
ncbi:MAG: beta-lactamase regulator AmpE [Thalassotalea sp.]